MKPVFDRPPLYLYSESQMPPAGITQVDMELRWFSNDTEERYKDKPHPSLAPEDIVYRFNSKGYRCPEFDLAAYDGDDQIGHKDSANTLKVVSIGASEVFGVGLPEKFTFPQVFCEMLSRRFGCSTINWNLGISGGSADYISRVLFSVLPVLKPDIVLLVFPPILRREFVNDTDRLFIYTDRIDSYGFGSRLLYRFYDPENTRQNSAHRALSSDNSDQINFFKNYQLCEALCQKHDVMWLYSPFSELQLQHTKDLINHDHLVLPGLLDLRDECLKTSDGIAGSLARDLGHPGIKPNQLFAESLFARLQALYEFRLPAVNSCN